MEIEIDYWERLKEVMTEDGLFVGVPFLLHLIAFWGLSLFFRHVDLYHTPISIYKKKFQPKKHVTKEEYNEIILCALSQQFFVGLPFFYLVRHLFSMIGMGLDTSSNFPPMWKILIDFIATIICEDFFFFTSHLLMHKIPFLYQKIHKKHHRFQAPVGAASIYAHPIETAVSSLFPAFVGPFLMNSHIVFLWVWFTFVTINTVIAHSGYFISSRDHDIHHEKFAYNYGIGIFDRIFGTFKRY